MNNQLRDLLETYNTESKKLRDNYEKREVEYQTKISELNKLLILQEKKMVDKVIESIEMKHQAYHGKGVEFDYMNKMDEEYEKLRNKRKDIASKLSEKDEYGSALVEPQPISKSNEPKKQPTVIEEKPSIKKEDTAVKQGSSLPPPGKVQTFGKQVTESSKPMSNKFSNEPSPAKETKKLTDEIDDFDEDFGFD